MSTFYFRGPLLAMSKVHDLFIALTPRMPPQVHLHFPPAGDIISAETGQLTGAWSDVPLGDLVGTDGGGNYAAPAGACLTWNTASILDGTRVKGRTFIVPLSNTQYDDGSLSAASLAVLTNAANAFVAASAPDNFVVWHRPYPGRPAGVLPARAAHPGAAASVTSSSVRDTVAILTSRRD